MAWQKKEENPKENLKLKHERHHWVEKEQGMVVEGRNPVLELLKAQREIDRLFVAKEASGSLAHIVARAKEAGCTVVECDRHKLDAMSEGKAHQGVIAYVSPVAYSTIEDMLAQAKERGEAPLLLILDGILDPHNLGAILRSAEVFGAHGVILPKRRSAPLSAACIKASAGAIEYVPVCRVSNIAMTIKKLKDLGIWIYGTDATGEKTHFETDFKGPCALVIGSEGEGVSRLVLENCDFIVRIPMRGKITSLNASNAAAVVLSEAVRQRQI